MQFNADGSGGKISASGLRNAVGLAFSRGTGALWAAVNERDDLGDNVPPDYATAIRQGGFYGWPYYYIGAHHDPRMPAKPALARAVIVPDILFEAHVAALGIAFYTGRQFPPSLGEISSSPCTARGTGRRAVAMSLPWRRCAAAGRPAAMRTL